METFYQKIVSKRKYNYVCGHNFCGVEEILYKSGMLFMERGFKAVTMDVIAQELGISKKTIYKYFANKKEIVSKTIDIVVSQEKAIFRKFKESAGDAIQEMIDLIRHVIQMFDDVDIKTFEELKKYYPESWVKMDRFLTDHIYKRIVRNIERGKKEGLYRSDVDADIIARMYVIKVLGIMEENAFPRDHYNKRHLMKVLVEYHMRGIVTGAGSDNFEKQLKKLK